MTSPPDELAERALIKAAQGGSLDAFNGLVEQYQRLVFAVCLRLVRDRALAEDVTQDTFLRAYTALNQFSEGSFRAWLVRIATNRAYDVLRSRGRKPLQSLDDQVVEETPVWSSEGFPDDPLERAENVLLGARLERALAQLPDEQRLVVLLYDVHGYSYDEIAIATDASLGTVKSRLSRARARLRDDLRADEQSRELFDAVRRQL